MVRGRGEAAGECAAVAASFNQICRFNLERIARIERR
jgi:hypothetical protein